MIRNMTGEDDITRFCEVLAQTDRYIFDEKAKKDRLLDYIARNVGKEGTLFAYNNIYVLIDSETNEIVGQSIVLSSPVKHIEPEHESPEKIKKVFAEHFNTQGDNVGTDIVYIAYLSIDNEYRGNGYGLALLQEIIERNKEKTIMLHVLKENERAIKLYEKAGFIKARVPILGFSYDWEDRPECYEMMRKPDM